MKKSKIAFVCQDCGSEYTKWQGQCHDCNAWNTLKQIQLGNARSERRREGYTGALEAVQTLGEVALAEQPRLASSSDEFNRVFGGRFCRVDQRFARRGQEYLTHSNYV